MSSPAPDLFEKNSVMKTIVIAPHADDEMLGCGGTLLRRRDEGGIIGWLLMTVPTETCGWTREQIEKRQQEIATVRDQLGIEHTHCYQLHHPASSLDQQPLSQLVQEIDKVFQEFRPNEILVPHPGDIHSDHRVTFQAAISNSKWFRHPCINKIMAYETISETDASLNQLDCFQPTVFYEITTQLEEKLELAQVYASEIGGFPFPRSTEALAALAKVRGAQSGFLAAEAFQLLRERVVRK